MSPKNFETYSVGICAASVCTSLPLEEATERLNSESPTGITSRWSPSEEPTFKGGQSNPCACETHPETHKHYLFRC